MSKLTSQLYLYAVLIVLSVGSAIVLIGCGGGGGGSDSTEASSEVRLTLTWDPNPEEEQVLGYLVFFGFAANTASQLLSTLLVGAADFNASAPSTSYEAGRQLGVRAGDTACFRLKAFNGAGESDFSEAACITI